MSLTELPYNLQGNIFRSPMPFGKYDPSGENFREFKQKNIKVIVLLAQDQECEHKAGRNLREFYKQEGFQVIHFPIPDFGIPSNEDLQHFALKTIECARKGHNIVIHCSAGIGRTGLFAAYLAKQVFDLPGKEAITWVRKYIDGAVETDEQRQLIIYDTIDQNEWFNWGNSFRDMERYEEALECYNKAIEINPNNEYSWLIKIETLNHMKRYEEALESFNGAIGKFGQGKSSFWDFFSYSELYQEAMGCYNHALEINPDNKGALWWKGFIYIDRMRYEDALECYDKLAEIDPYDEEAWKKKGLTLLIMERYEEAVKCFSKLIKINPNNELAFENKGLALLNLGHYEEALKCFNKTIKLEPKDENSWDKDDRSRFLHNLMEDVKALKSCNKEIEINPNDEYTWINKGLYLHEMRSCRLDGLIDYEYYNAGFDPYAIDPSKYRSSLIKRRDEEVMECFNKAIEINPNEKLLLIKVKTCIYYSCYWALEYLNKAIETNQEDKDAWFLKSSVLRSMGREEETLECYNKFLEKNPEDKKGWYLKGSFLKHLKRYDEALKCLNKAIEIDSNDKYARKVVDEIMKSEHDSVREHKK